MASHRWLSRLATVAAATSLLLLLLHTPVEASKKPVIADDCEAGGKDGTCAAAELEKSGESMKLSEEQRSAQAELSQILAKLGSSPMTKAGRERVAEDLQYALQQAESVRLPSQDSVMTSAKASLLRLERQVSAMEELDQIGRDDKQIDVELLEQALEEAREAGMDAKDLAIAEMTLAKERRRTAAESAMESAYDALRTLDPSEGTHESFEQLLEQLNVTVKEAEAASVESMLVGDVKAYLERKQSWCTVRYNLTKLLEEQRDVEAVRAAEDLFQELQDVGEDKALLASAQALLEKDSQREAAMLRLERLIDMKAQSAALEAAIKEAEAAGARKQDLMRARKELKLFVQREKATTALEDAMMTRDAAKLREAIPEGEKADVDGFLLQHAQDALDQMDMETESLKHVEAD
eukprot:TRINITY_DN6300_c0_g2_i1.p1 TRINITY_DN6300_c0_g2~~TRINITY_DN6300_c0_g2_i1.p1  ORF type:complete len:426 (-),score=160.40 TRINITY_DN6300_c0_g2_i1:641-1867(-)